MKCWTDHCYNDADVQMLTAHIRGTGYPQCAKCALEAADRDLGLLYFHNQVLAYELTHKFLETAQ